MRQNPEHGAPRLRRGRGFNDPGSIPAGFGEVLHSYRAMQQQSSAVGLR